MNRDKPASRRAATEPACFAGRHRDSGGFSGRLQPSRQRRRAPASGRLPEGYRHGAGGFDELLTGSLSIDNGAFVADIENAKPGYLQLEAWVKEHARNLTRDMNAEMAAERRERFGIADPTFAHGVSLNDLDDWDQAFRRITNSAAPPPAG